jgi:hypothetical protein
MGALMATISGGNRWAERLAAITRSISNASAVQIGFLADARYPDGKPVAMIAAIQEYGAPSVGIPPRPFFRNMIAAKKGEWPEAVAGLLEANDYDALRTLQLTGEAISGQLRESIIETNTPPLADSTIVRKGGIHGMKYDPKDPSTFPAKPLVDTGHMLNSIEYEVKA